MEVLPQLEVQTCQTQRACRQRVHLRLLHRPQCIPGFCLSWSSGASCSNSWCCRAAYRCTRECASRPTCWGVYCRTTFGHPVCICRVSSTCHRCTKLALAIVVLRYRGTCTDRVIGSLEALCPFNDLRITGGRLRTGRVVLIPILAPLTSVNRVKWVELIECEICVKVALQVYKSGRT